MKNRGEKFAVIVIFYILQTINLNAQDAMSFLNEANAQIRTVGSLIYQIVIAVLSIIAIVSLITVGIKLYSGDQESANKALGWCGGMVFCIIAALVLKNFIGLGGKRYTEILIVRFHCLGLKGFSLDSQVPEL